MVRSVDHLVETHRLARERRAAGKPVWKYTLYLSDVFHNDEMTFEQIRDAIVDRIRRSQWFSENKDLEELVNGLCGAEDGDEFDDWFGQIYDIADFDRVWVETNLFRVGI